jgi:SAM-dependent methyltransferase
MNDDLLYRYLNLVRRHQRFSFDGKLYPYFIFRHNTPFNSERIVEVPIFKEIIAGHQGSVILEIGNVLSNYLSFPHDIVDKYEKSGGVLNEDIISYSPGKQYDLVVSISTFEHVGFDEDPTDPQKVGVAIEHCKSLLKPGGRLMFSIPVGHNRNLEELLFNGSIATDRLLGMKRISRLNKWKEVRPEKIRKARYNKPYRFANAILVGYWKNRNLQS